MAHHERPTGLDRQWTQQAPAITARNPVALFANGIGDHVLVVPALRAIAQTFSGRLTLVCSRDAPRFLFDELRVERLVALDFRRENNTKEFDVAELAPELSTCDLFMSLVPWRSASMSRLLAEVHPAISIGFAKEFQIQVPRGRSDHMADVAFRVARAVRSGLHLADLASPLPLPPDSIAEAREIRARQLGSKRVLLVHADSVREKMWPPGRLKAVLNRFLELHQDFGICLVGKSSSSFTGSTTGGRVLRVYDLTCDSICPSIAGRTLPGRGLLHASCGRSVPNSSGRSVRSYAG